MKCNRIFLGNHMGYPNHQDYWRDTRYPIKIRIELELEDGSKVFVTTSNFSTGGLQFKCDSWVARKIEPRGIHLHSLDHINLTIRSEPHHLLVHAQIMFAQRLSEHEFSIGVKFTDLDNQIVDKLSSLMQSENHRPIASR